MTAVRVLEYLDRSGRSPWRRWFNDLDAHAAAKVGTALYRIGQGNFSTVEGVGSGVYEARIDSGPGYRIYCRRSGDTVLLLLAGGDKRTQVRDIDRSRRLARDLREG